MKTERIDEYPNTFTGLITLLQRWYGDDQEDWCYLRRHEVGIILDGVKL